VKGVRLVDYRVVYFTTHGLVARDVKGLAEPSLALMPKQPTEFDDGTVDRGRGAAAQTQRGLAGAVGLQTRRRVTPPGQVPKLYQASRVHSSMPGRGRFWSRTGAVASGCQATRLTTSTFDIIKLDPKVGRAEAWRRAMINYLNDTSDPLNAYPAFWAPFEVVAAI
jgi:hypothetical protein